MPFHCKSCGLYDFRISRFRRSDFPFLMKLLYPVRCRNCYERAYVFLFRAFRISREAKLRRKKRSREREASASE
jgi:hypothetical protein